MIAPDLETAVDKLRELVDGARRIAPFTGAGISTECGIPDFRSPGGLWTKTRPIQFEDFLASQEMRDEAWRRRFAMEQYFAAARPGRGHLALASLHRRGKAPGVITQNIDNLHQDLRIAARARHRAARQQHLRTLSRLRQALRAVLGARRSSPRTANGLPIASLRRLYQDCDNFVRSVDA